MTSFSFRILCALLSDAHHKADEEGRRAEGVGGVHEEEPVHTACIRRDEGRGQRNIRRKAECGEIETVFGRRGMQSGLSGAYARTHRDTATRAHKLACVLWWPSWVRAWAIVRAYVAAIRWARARHGDKERGMPVVVRNMAMKARPKLSKAGIHTQSALDMLTQSALTATLRHPPSPSRAPARHDTKHGDEGVAEAVEGPIRPLGAREEGDADDGVCGRRPPGPMHRACVASEGGRRGGHATSVHKPRRAKSRLERKRAALRSSAPLRPDTAHLTACWPRIFRVRKGNPAPAPERSSAGGRYGGTGHTALQPRRRQSKLETQRESWGRRNRPWQGLQDSERPSHHHHDDHPHHLSCKGCDPRRFPQKALGSILASHKWR